MARGSNSDSEAKPRTTTTNSSHTGGSIVKNSGKQRLTGAQSQYIKDLVRIHITNNHPDLEPKTAPVDFEHYSDEFLRRYKDHYHLDVQDNLTLRGYLLGSELGSRSHTAQINQPGQQGARVHKSVLAQEVKKHFTNYNIKETVCIPQFIYKVKTQRKNFKMEFKD